MQRWILRCLSSFASPALEGPLLSNETKREYETAQEITPQLVLRETPLINFLRTDDYQPQRAARRLALYWKYRKEFFGERWLLPMDQTGRGALTVQDVQLLHSGWMFVYRAGPEEVLIVIDRSKLFKVYEQAQGRGWNNVTQTLDRCSMYLLTVNTNRFAQLKGVTHIQMVSSQKRPPPSFRQKFWEGT